MTRRIRFVLIAAVAVAGPLSLAVSGQNYSTAPPLVITAAFAGKDKKTMYAVVSLSDSTRLQHAFVYAIPMIAQGYKGRAK